MRIEINRQRIGYLGSGDYFCIDLVPGQHRISAHSRRPDTTVPAGGFTAVVTNRGEAHDYATFVAEAGGLYFFATEFELFTEAISILELNPEDGMEDVRGSDLLRPSLRSIGFTFRDAPAENAEVRVQKMVDDSILLNHDLKRLAVLNIEGGTIDAEVRALLSNIILQQASRMLRRDVIGMSDIEAMLDAERRKDLLGCDDVSCFTEIGGALNVDAVFTSTVGRLGERYLFTGSLIDTRGGQVLLRAEVSYEGKSEALPAIVENLVRQMLMPLAR